MRIELLMIVFVNVKTPIRIPISFHSEDRQTEEEQDRSQHVVIFMKYDKNKMEDDDVSRARAAIEILFTTNAALVIQRYYKKYLRHNEWVVL